MANVLVADDDVAIRTLVQRVLVRDGFAVDLAADGREALAKIRSREYDAVVLDLMMPIMSGYEVLAVLTKERPTSKCVVIMSAAASKEIARADLTIVTATLRKPFDIDELTSAVRACLED